MRLRAAEERMARLALRVESEGAKVELVEAEATQAVQAANADLVAERARWEARLAASEAEKARLREEHAVSADRVADERSRREREKAELSSLSEQLSEAASRGDRLAENNRVLILELEDARTSADGQHQTLLAAQREVASLRAAQVHYVMMPEVDQAARKPQIITAVQRLQEVVELGRYVREQRKVGLKTPLKTMKVLHADPAYGAAAATFSTESCPS